MPRTILAHFTDAHLGQRLAARDEIAGSKMGYEETPGEHEWRMKIVLDDISRKGISHVVFGGDIGGPSSVAGFFKLLHGYGFELSLVLGNHDKYGDMIRYRGAGEAVVEGKHCYSRGDRHLKRIFLDSSDNLIGGAQRAWLAHELSDADRAAIFVHHPVLALDTPLDRTGAALQDREELKSLLAGAPCEVSVFCGHYHMIDEAREANIRQYVTPAVSYQIVKQSEKLQVDTKTFGYRILELDGAEIRTQVILFTTA